MSGHSQVRWTLKAIGPSASNHKLDGQVAAIHRVDLVSEPAIFKVACQSDRVMVGQPCRPFVFCIGALRAMNPEGARTCAPWIQVVASRVPPPQAREKSPKHHPTNLWQPAGRWGQTCSMPQISLACKLTAPSSTSAEVLCRCSSYPSQGSNQLFLGKGVLGSLWQGGTGFIWVLGMYWGSVLDASLH